jgi:hypothetical protein
MTGPIPIQSTDEPDESDELDIDQIVAGALATKARRSLAEFTRRAIGAGVVPGISKVEWGPHLDAFCFATQMQLEAWLVAYGYGPPTMVARQREAWERTGATWEDGAPEPWLRYVLVQNQLDNLPPGTLKSTIAMVVANAWIWLWAPKFAFGAASGVELNVGRDSKATQDLVKSSWYQTTFGVAWQISEPASAVKLRSDSTAVTDWETSAGGKRLSRTWGTGFTGAHVDGTFLDDPDDADRVWNEAARVGTQNRFTRAIENRVNCEHRSIRKVMQQVVHVDGFSAYLLSIARWSPQNPKGWARLCIPAEFGFGPADAPEETPYGWRDWRTEPGETMHRRLTAGVLADKRSKMPGYEGQYNQNPESNSNGIFERRHARFFVFEGTNIATLRRRPEGCPSRTEQPPVVIRLSDLNRLTLSVDAANSLNPKPGAKVSAVGLTVNGCRGEERYVLDDRTRVLGVSATYRAIYEILGVWPLDKILVELKALGAGVIDEVTKSIRRGWYLDEEDEKVQLLGPDGGRIRASVVPSNPGKEDKVQRAHGMLPLWEQGMIFLLDGAPWLYPQVDENRKTVDEGMIGEVCSFPASRRNDRVDSISQFVAENRVVQDPRERWRAMSRVAHLAARR